MLLNQDQDLLADLSIAICSSYKSNPTLHGYCLHVTLETLITLLTIENNIIKNYFVTFVLSVTGKAFSIHVF